MVTLQDGVAGLETLTFNRSGLLSFSFQALNTDPFQPNFSFALQVDNIVLDQPIATVPLPAGWSLFGSAALLTAAWARRGRAAVKN